MRARWLRRALRDLDEAAEFIAREDPQAAARMVELITSSIDCLTIHPASGRPGRVPGTRELVIPDAPYIIPYRVHGDTVEILRVFHGARKWPRAF